MKDEFLSKAKENLKAAQILYDDNLFNASANRAYFAAFQIAIVALVNNGVTNKSFVHKWVQSAFNKELIKKRRIYPSRIRSYLVEMLTMRNKADYDEVLISKKRAYRQLSKAQEFVEIVMKGLTHD